MMFERSLVPYSGTPTDGRVDVRLDWEGRSSIFVIFRASGFSDGVLLPQVDTPERKHELWRHTCCEVFGRRIDGGYAEFNLSPSGDWAAYTFDGYRTGMRDLDVPRPDLRLTATANGFELGGWIFWSEWPHIEAIGLSAVIEMQDGVKTYWALVHPSDQPDFHHPDAFAIKSPALEPS